MSKKINYRCGLLVLGENLEVITHTAWNEKWTMQHLRHYMIFLNWYIKRVNHGRNIYLT